MPAKKSRPATHRPMHPRCNFQFADGRRCRMLRDPRLDLCLFHHRELLQLQSAEEISAELLALGGDFQDPIALNFVLGKLFAHVATGRMHRRQASTLAYIAQLLLQTLDKRRYNLARDRYDYRAFIPALDALYGPDGTRSVSSASVEVGLQPGSSAASVKVGLQPGAFDSSSTPADLGAAQSARSSSSRASSRPNSRPSSSSTPKISTDQFPPTTTNAHQPPEPHARL